MRWTKTLIPTLREAPSDAEIVSHKLLLRAGLIRKLAGGVYTFLPLGLRALRKVEQIIREEMNRADAVEVLMPALQPTDIWEQSGRAETASNVLFKVKDSSGRQWFLSPTAEEVITTLAAGEINSYRQLPKNFYQVSSKFRDEIRPRFGLMRAKEFIMKDAYSFDTTDEGAMASYKKMYDAYKRIFDRCGVQNFPVEADTGVIGGNHSHEFMVPADTGENDVVFSEACGYAANIEKATSGIPKTAARELGAAIEKFATPGVVTIEALSKEPYKVPANRQIKTLIYIADSSPIIILVRGDDQLNETKLMAKIGAVAVRPATVEEIIELLGARPGSLGALTVTIHASRQADYFKRYIDTLKLAMVRIIADERLRGANLMVTGANEDGYHYQNVSVERDIKVADWFDLRTVTAGEPCGKCGKSLKIRRAIEVGHVFKLGTKYSEKLGSYFLDEAGARNPCVMGCYGIGVTRTLQAIIEQCNDKDGIVWPMSVAPYQVCITPLAVAAEHQCMVVAEKLYAELAGQGVDVILDDRDERPGVKFKDADLVGFPIRVSIGEKSLAKGEVEIKPRNGPVQFVKTEALLESVRAMLAAGGK